ncbi:MAG: FHA domain-containing protein [Anaerolineae bacterium]|nr:FHA domain-containing protein [Anaerolineae bacterium]MCB0223724.1 FHA domain-containing protein [Anaerolineae bacterium]
MAISNMVSSAAPPLLAIKGQVTVNFVDGQILDGEFKAQDAFNIFLVVSGEPIMIPRTQIRFIKGSHVDQIEVDTSPSRDRQITSESVSSSVKSEPASAEAEEDGTIVLAPGRPEESLEDGTVVRASSIPEPAPIPVDDLEYEVDEDEDEDEDEDGTLVLSLDDLSQEAVDEDGTFLLPPFDADADDPDRTDIMPPLPETPDDDSDTTIVMPLTKNTLEVTAKLTCVSGPHTGDEFTLKSGITTVGRSSDNGVVLSKDKEISRHHAIFIQESGRFVVQDQNSLNGTFVNDEQITSPHYLKNGDVVLVGVSSLKYHEG